MKENFALYTAVFDNNDKVVAQQTPMKCNQFVYNNLGKVRFADDQLNKYCDFPELSGTKKNRRIKIFPDEIFEKYEFSLYIDSNVELFVDPIIFIDMIRDFDMILFKHHRRNCIYKEHEAIKSNGFRESHPFLPDNFYEKLKNQIEKYRKRGWPEENGLYWGGFLLRKHTDKVIKFSNAWLHEVLDNSERDQISLPVMLKKHKINVLIIDENIVFNNFLRILPHEYSNRLSE